MARIFAALRSRPQGSQDRAAAPVDEGGEAVGVPRNVKALGIVSLLPGASSRSSRGGSRTAAAAAGR